MQDKVTYIEESLCSWQGGQGVPESYVRAQVKDMSDLPCPGESKRLASVRTIYLSWARTGSSIHSVGRAHFLLDRQSESVCVVPPPPLQREAHMWTGSAPRESGIGRDTLTSGMGH